jgi:hypothetical protein
VESFEKLIAICSSQLAAVNELCGSIILAMADQKREPQFKVEYQVGKETLKSITVTHAEYISVDYMIQATLMLVRDVRCEIDEDTGGRVALAALKLIRRLANSSDNDITGHGDVYREKLDYKSKHKANRSERVDMVLYGKGGQDKGYNKVISRMIALMRKSRPANTDMAIKMKGCGEK